MLRISYDTKPFKPPVVDRIRLNVIDSFINAEKILLDVKIKILLSKGCNKSILKKVYDKLNLQLEEELEKKRIFMIRLRSVLSFRKPEAKKFIEKLNEENKFDFKKYYNYRQ